MKGKKLGAPGGTGKTFLINLLLVKVRFDKKENALAVASSGIAATLLEGGRIAHSTFKLPLKICTDDVSSICNIWKQNYAGKLMKDCSLQILGWGIYVLLSLSWGIRKDNARFAQQ